VSGTSGTSEASSSSETYGLDETPCDQRCAAAHPTGSADLAVDVEQCGCGTGAACATVCTSDCMYGVIPADDACGACVLPKLGGSACPLTSCSGSHECQALLGCYAACQASGGTSTGSETGSQTTTTTGGTTGETTVDSTGESSATMTAA